MNWYKTHQYKEAEWSWKRFLTPPLLALITILGLSQLDVQELFQRHNGNPLSAQKELKQKATVSAPKTDINQNRQQETSIRRPEPEENGSGGEDQQLSSLCRTLRLFPWGL